MSTRFSTLARLEAAANAAGFSDFASENDVAGYYFTAVKITNWLHGEDLVIALSSITATAKNSTQTKNSRKTKTRQMCVPDGTPVGVVIGRAMLDNPLADRETIVRLCEDRGVENNGRTIETKYDDIRFGRLKNPAL